MFKRLLLTALLFAGLAVNHGHGVPADDMVVSAVAPAGTLSGATHQHTPAANCVDACGGEETPCCMDMSSHCGTSMLQLSNWHPCPEFRSPAGYQRSIPGPVVTILDNADPPPPKAKA